MWNTVVKPLLGHYTSTPNTMKTDKYSFTTLVLSTPPPTPTPTPIPIIITAINIGGASYSTQITAQGVVQQTVSGTSTDQQISINIPVGTTILTPAGVSLASMAISPCTNPPARPSDCNTILPYDFDPSGITFNPPITLVWSYGQATLLEGVDEASLQVEFYNTTTSRWEVLYSVVDVDNHKITAKVSHFTTFAVMAPLPTPTPSPTPTVVPTPTPTPTSTPEPPESNGGGIDWWVWLLIGLAGVVVIGVFWLWQRSRHKSSIKS